MAVPIKMPDLGTTVDEFRFMLWRVAEGDTVALGDILAEIETDKAIAELESTTSGVVLKLIAVEDSLVQTGEILAYVGEAGETIPQEAAPSPTPTPTPTPTQALSPAIPTGALNSPPAAPVVRNLASSLGVDLALVRGSGEGGVITREDVRRASQAAPAPAPETLLLTRRQAAVARAVTKSWQEIPHIYFSTSVDMTAAQRLRAQAAASGGAISYDAIILKALGRAMISFPLFTARLDGEWIVRTTGINIAVAIGVDDDLYLPVIRDVDHKSLAGVQQAITDFSALARAGNLHAEQLAGASLAISNLGMFAIDSFDPIIFPEHNAMLAIGTIRKTPVVVGDDAIAIRPLAHLRLAVDHRLINGRTAAAFLGTVKQLIENGEMG